MTGLKHREVPSNSINRSPSDHYVVILENSHPQGAFKSCLDGASGVNVVYAGNDSLRLMAQLRAVGPAVAILDASIPLGIAFDAADAIRAQFRCVKLILVLEQIRIGVLEQALRARPEGLLLRSDVAKRLVSAVNDVSRDQTVVSPALDDHVSGPPCHERMILRYDTPLSGLSDQAVAVMRHLARGEESKAVARKLSISFKSVESFRYRIMKRFGIHNKVQLSLFAVREGVISP